ncbi:MAG: hypothetical protein ABFD69_08260 [Candidatus Sumerlaeia bacterium]
MIKPLLMSLTMLMFASAAHAAEADAGLSHTLEIMRNTYRDLHRLSGVILIDVYVRNTSGTTRLAYLNDIEMIRFDNKFNITNNDGSVTRRLAFDGDRFKRWNTTPANPAGSGRFNHATRTKPETETSMESWVHSAPYFGNWPFLFMAQDTMPIHRLLASNSKSVTVRSRSGGAEQLVIACLKTGDYEFRIDCNRGCLVTEGKVLRKRSRGHMKAPKWADCLSQTFSFKVLMTQKLGDVWVPIEAEADEVAEYRNQPIRRVHYKLKLKEFKLLKSEPPAGTFDFEFPEGASICDSVTGAQYIAGQNGALLPALKQKP